MKERLPSLIGAIGLFLIVVGAEWATWTAAHVTVPGALAVTGIILIVLAIIAWAFIDIMMD